jgi:hypothetical protein
LYRCHAREANAAKRAIHLQSIAYSAHFSFTELPFYLTESEQIGLSFTHYPRRAFLSLFNLTFAVLN